MGKEEQDTLRSQSFICQMFYSFRIHFIPKISTLTYLYYINQRTFFFRIHNPSAVCIPAPTTPPTPPFFVRSFSCLNMITPQRGRFRISLDLLCEMLNVVRRENQSNNIVTSGGRFNHSRATNCLELNIFYGKKINMSGKFLQYLYVFETSVQLESILCAFQTSCSNSCLLNYSLPGTESFL
jgi:hypothetical protein